MPDNRATFQAAMAALFPDNTSQEISAADQRDVSTQDSDNSAYQADDNSYTGVNEFLNHVLFARVQSSATSLTLGTATIYVFAGSSAAIWTFPDTTGLTGKFYVLANSGTANVSLDGNGTDPILNSDPWVLRPGQAVLAFWVTQYTGPVGTSEWIIIG